MIYNSNKNYDELLRNNNEVSIHQSHLRALICEVFKSLNNLNPEFMWSYFVFKNITYNIRKGPLLRLPAAKSTSYGINSVLFRACLLWNSLPQSIKYSESIAELKTKMKDLGNIDCSCILFRWIVYRTKVLFTLWVDELILISVWDTYVCVWLPHWYHFSVCSHMT